MRARRWRLVANLDVTGDGVCDQLDGGDEEAARQEQPRGQLHSAHAEFKSSQHNCAHLVVEAEYEVISAVLADLDRKWSGERLNHNHVITDLEQTLESTKQSHEGHHLEAGVW